MKRAYPVITLVLYFGTKHWNYERSLLGVLDVPDKFRPYVSDYEMKNLYEIAFLTPEQVELFRSDFKYVADYFVQKRMNDDYHPSKETIEHVDATLKLMSVLTDDARFEEAIRELSGKGGTSMCTVLDRIENKGREEGLLEGRLESYAMLVQKGVLSVADAVKWSGLSVDELEKWIQQHQLQGV